MHKGKQDPVVNLGEIAFPTDRITLGQLRQEQPGVFNHIDIMSKGMLAVAAAATLHMQTALAQKAFAAAAGKPDPRPNEDRLECILLLNEDYQRYGLSSGIQQTRQLVREFEKAAAQQAKSLSGKRR